MLAPTAETRRELSTAADDCVSSGSVVWSEAANDDRFVMAKREVTG